MASMAARAARQFPQIATSSRSAVTCQPSALIHRRGLAGGGDHHGPPKVNLWEDPMNPSRWKEEHFVIASATGWGLLFFGGYKFFTRGKKDKEELIMEHPNK
ncbi:hypothetical protein RJ641_000238 [Dillenia turbinata]|uniref:Uncharacterized protein n=1 Tax=Dillenia turbinata TaxID=194707 RepID=A0AAN8W7Q3_9MAGN